MDPFYMRLYAIKWNALQRLMIPIIMTTQRSSILMKP